jgi:tetratricopeptide (TPR) repeat protein
MSHESTGTAGNAAGSPAAVDPAPTASAGLSPAERSRLTRCFQTGTQNAPTNTDYAIEMFGACVGGDPGNAVYLQAFLGVLRRKFLGKKAGGLTALWSAGVRGLKKLATNAQWREIIKQGVESLKINPSDHGCLLAMAEACGNLMLPDAQAVYLRAALDAAPTDVEVNRQCAKFAANQGQFDQAIECWRRISKIKGMGEEADREIARLSVEKTIVGGHGMTGRPGAAGVAKPASGQGGPAAAAAGDPIAALRQKIQQQPTEIEPYLELADLLERDSKVDEAERLLAKALAASGNDLKVREHVEDRQLRWARQKVMIAEKRLQAEDTADTRAAVERLKAAQLRQEIEVYSARCERYPENVTWKYELAMRLKAAGNYAEAIRGFQEVLQDARRKGAVSLELGECFQKIKQYQLAMKNYQTAVEVLTDREQELRKRALYRAGVLATGLNDVDAAQKYLSTLAGLDFGYRDVAERLDKLGSVKDKGASETEG